MSVKKEANSLHDLVDGSSEATDTGGFVCLSAAANKAGALLCLGVLHLGSIHGSIVKKSQYLVQLLWKIEIHGLTS